MHMADALLSPAVGAAMWAASAATIAYSSKKVREDLDDRRIPLMGVLGAFIFAAQMINFTIPATGSSGHLGGGMILAALLGPYAAFLAMASVLTVQALFFADGGLLALGCNIFNLGFCTCFVAYPLLFKPLAGVAPTRGRLVVAALIAAVVALQLGAFGVVMQTTASGISSLPFATFALLMQTIHLGIGIVEGLVTAAVLAFVWKARPEILATTRPLGAISLKQVLVGLALVTVFTGGVLSWFASSHPDGLEWALFQVSGREELEGPAASLHHAAAQLQEKTSLLPDYRFKQPTGAAAVGGVPSAWPEVDAGTSVSGLVGGIFTLVLVGLVAFGLKWRRKAAAGRVSSPPVPS